MTTDTPKTDALYAKIWLPINEDQVDEALGTLRDHARQMERDAREYKAELERVQARETELNIQARRDAERADANAAEVGRLRAELGKIAAMADVIPDDLSAKQAREALLPNDKDQPRGPRSGGERNSP